MAAFVRLLLSLAACLLLHSRSVCLAQAQRSESTLSVLFLPLDERFTTRDAFINLAAVTPYEIITPPTSLLPHRKQPAPLDELTKWVEDHITEVDAAIISSEMYLYGGLIASRSSNDSTAVVTARLNRLLEYRTLNPSLKLYLSSVVMRIPSYNEDEEEPWYWAYYGRDLYLYSYYLDDYDVTGNTTALKLSNAAKAMVPPAIVDKFLWRRSRNFNVTTELLARLHDTPPADRFYNAITLDDNAKYGLNIAESRRLKAMVQSDDLSKHVLIYPGADEVALTMLSRLAVDDQQGGTHVRLGVIYRDPATISLIPNYEGQPMVETLLNQVEAAGGVAVNGSTGCAGLLLVNNFSEFPQIEAPNQPLANRSIGDYSMFTKYACSAPRPIVGWTDNRYSNGADRVFVQYMASLASDTECNLSMSSFAYAGWNTDGNTLGTVIANTILLTLFGGTSPPPSVVSGNTYFNALRIVEDDGYQANVRQRLVAYVGQTLNDTVYTLSNDLPFYQRYSLKLLYASLHDVSQTYKLPWQLDTAYYPWNRTFEIGLVASRGPDSSSLKPHSF